jgi:hypothetical protein
VLAFVDTNGDRVSNCRTRLRGIPTKLAPLLAIAKNEAEALRMLTDGVEQAIEELSQ